MGFVLFTNAVLQRRDSQYTNSRTWIVCLGGHVHGYLPLHHQASRSLSPCLHHSGRCVLLIAEVPSTLILFSCVHRPSDLQRIAAEA